MNNTPEASQLVLLSQIVKLAAGKKVRFLGCVDRYDTPTATVLLKDRYAGSSTDAGFVTVNVSNILDALNVELTQIGAWINVVGYVGALESRTTQVDAVMIWSAGAVKLDAYEAAVRDLQATSGL